MYKQVFILVIFSLVFSSFSKDSHADKYIKTYHKIAVKEMKRARIPASITLAQGMLESDFGRGELAINANNHFGMKCGSKWEGDNYYKVDDDKDASGKLIESCFRAYNSVEESFVAHSGFLIDPTKDYRYGFLFDYDTDDYQSWAVGLLKSGYATDKNYAKKLISLIENYELFKFDKSLPKVGFVKVDDRREKTISEINKDKKRPVINKYKKKTHKPGQILNQFGLKYIMAKKGETPEDIASKYNIHVDRLLGYNIGIDKNHIFSKGDIMYLERKNNSSIGPNKIHKVKKGETMYTIAQKHGIRLKELHKKNRIPMDAEPLVGQRLSLKVTNIFKKIKYKKRVEEKEEFLFTEDDI